jgi:hypothetical protein
MQKTQQPSPRRAVRPQGMAYPRPSAVDISFVKASTSSITLDLLIVGGADDKVACYELQWRCETDQGSWSSASRALKTRRCTKGNLHAGKSYVFRARASAGNEKWGPFGDETPPLLTKLPELPEDCSESLKVPSKVIAAAAEAAAEEARKIAKDKETRDAEQAELARQEEAMKKMRDQEDSEFSENEMRCEKIISAALAEAATKAECALEEGAEAADNECRERITKEI